jgi:hypothetical protein
MKTIGFNRPLKDRVIQLIFMVGKNKGLCWVFLQDALY